MVSEVCSAVDAGVRSVAVGQIRLERFHHGGTGTAIQTAGRLRLKTPHKAVKTLIYHIKDTKKQYPEKARAIKHRRMRIMCGRKTEKNVQQQ